jgi:hypothetical protein
MFAAPNTAAIMNSVPAEDRGAASGMCATLQNAGMQLSMAVFFTIVLVGLASGLSGSVSGALSSAGATGPAAASLSSMVASNPTGALFGAFLGYNPMQLYISLFPPGTFSNTVVTALTAKQFFPNAVGPAFLKGIDLAFAISAILTAVAAVVSLMRGGRYVHELDAKDARPEPAPEAPGPQAQKQ